MNNKLFMYPYKSGSASSKELSEVLGIKRIKHKNSKFNPRGKVVINWGSSKVPQDIVNNAIMINSPVAVGNASNKLRAFKSLDGAVPLPDWTESVEDASEWLTEGHKVFCRTKLTGNSGEGIVIAEDRNELVDAPLYTKWSRIKREYRIHVFNGEVIDRQRKARNRDVPDDKVNWKVRNLEGGFIFARGDCQPEEGVEVAALIAVQHLGLTFGAVDVIFTRSGEVKVLEVNTACGLVGTTLGNYKRAINKYLGENNNG